MPQVLNQKKITWCVRNKLSQSTSSLITNGVFLNGIFMYNRFSALVIQKWRYIFDMLYQIFMMSSPAPNTPQTPKSPNIFIVTLPLVHMNMWWGYDGLKSLAWMKRKWKINLEEKLNKQYITFLMNDYESFWFSDFLTSSFQKMSVDLSSTFGSLS